MIHFRASTLGPSLLTLCALGASCSAPPTGKSEGDATGGTSGDGDLQLGDGDIDPGDGDINVLDDLPAPPGCGDGILTDDEACDDGGLAPGDGCAANCLYVEQGFICREAGMPV